MLAAILSPFKSLADLFRPAEFDPTACKLPDIFSAKAAPVRTAPPKRQTEWEDKFDHFGKEGVRTVQGKPGESEFETIYRVLDDVPDSARTPEIADADRLELQAKGLDEAKARFIKPHWAKKRSAAKVSRYLTKHKGRGFSQRTVEDFYAAFYRSARKGSGAPPPDR